MIDINTIVTQVLGSVTGTGKRIGKPATKPAARRHSRGPLSDIPSVPAIPTLRLVPEPFTGELLIIEENPDFPYHPVAQLVVIATEDCACCHGTTQTVVGRLIQHEHNTRRGTYRTTPANGYVELDLPLLVQSYSSSTPFCAQCLLTTERAKDIHQRAARQLSLFDPSDERIATVLF